MEFEATKTAYISNGAAITGGMTDEEAPEAIEEFEGNPPGAGEPSVEERTAAALEFLAMSSLPDDTISE